MKKLLAVLLALMLFVLPVAFAEPGVTITDPVVKAQISGMGDPMTIDLTGLEIVIAAGQAGEVPAVQVDIKGEGEKLFGMALNVVDNRVLIAPEGMSRAYYIDVPAEALADESMQNIQMPELDVQAITEKLLSSIEVVNENTIRIPHTAFNDLLEDLMPAIEQIPVPNFDASQVADAFKQMKESNSGVEALVTVNDENGQSFDIELYLVQNGQQTTSPLVKISADVSNGFNLYFEVAEQGSMSVSLVGEAFSFALNTTESSFGIDAKVATSEVATTFTAINAENAIDLQKIAEEDSEQIQSELMMSAGKLIMFLYGKLGMNPAA